MKKLGIVLVAVGLALLIFIGYNFVIERNSLKSPIPEEEGIKVIYVTPSK